MQYAASFVGWSNTGKTFLISQLVQIFTERGTRVGTLKKGHSAPNFEQQGKDTELFFQNGAERVGYISEHGGFIRFSAPPPFDQLKMYFASCDVLLLEGICIPDIPCFELIHSVDHPATTKYPPDQLTAYIATEFNTKRLATGNNIQQARAQAHTQAQAHKPTNMEQLPILPASKPDLIIRFLEELWNEESASK